MKRISMTATFICNTLYLENTHMDKFKIFKKVGEGKEVYLKDEQENCMMKFFVDEERVGAYLKRQGKSPYRVDIRNEVIFDIMNESDESTKEVYDAF